MKQDRSFIVDVLFVLGLFGVFAVSAFILITIGADVYQHTVQDMTSNYETRTAVSYITEKVRQNDAVTGDTEPCVSICTIEDIPALKLSRKIDNGTYFTYLYLYNGYLKELFISQYTDLGGSALEAGTNIMQLKDFQITEQGSNLLNIKVTTPHGNPHSFFISTHSRANSE